MHHQKRTKLLLTASILLLLTGCFFKSPEALYAVPKAPEDFQNLQAKIDEVRAAGAEYAAPLTGNYTQTVQLRDLDGNGTQEAIAFFRVTPPVGSSGKPLKIYIYCQQPDNTFKIQAIIEGDGSAINSIAYEDLNGDGARELVVSWQISAKVYQLMAYSIHGDVVAEIMRESYSDYYVMDLDRDNRKEIIILTVHTADGVHRADLFDFDDNRGRMVLVDSAPMSKEIISLADTRPREPGFLKDFEPALFVTSNVGIGVITDIFAWREGHLENITLNPETGMSESTFRLPNTVGMRDINSDSVMELPRPMAFPDPKKAGSADSNFWSIQWIQYSITGEETPVFTTYYNGEDGWYLMLPDLWSDLINPETPGQKITLSRRDVAGSGERGVVFSLWGGSETSEPLPFLVIYRLTGPNRESRSLLGGRFVLRRESDAIFAAEFVSGGWDCGFNADALTQQFSLIQPDRSTG